VGAPKIHNPCDNGSPPPPSPLRKSKARPPTRARAAPAPPLTSFGATHTRSVRVLINFSLLPPTSDGCGRVLGTNGRSAPHTICAPAVCVCDSPAPHTRLLVSFRPLMTHDNMPRGQLGEIRFEFGGKGSVAAIIQHVVRAPHLKCYVILRQVRRLCWFNEGSCGAEQ
jgi:hypothetical protein